MRVRTYGTSGPAVVVLHGGPGAPGHMAPVARGLADKFRIIEPFQRESGVEPLTVSRHVTDLHELIHSEGLHRPALVGSSWGAMLALAYAASNPDSTGPLVLIGCGTFDPNARAEMKAILASRMDDALRKRIEQLQDEISDLDQRLKTKAELILPLYAYNETNEDNVLNEVDARANQETWSDMVRLQEQGVYPQAFHAIKVPVLMLHGAFDPHPGPMIRASLQPYLPHLEYHEWQKCGHYPWRETEVREEFFSVLRAWLAKNNYSSVTSAGAWPFRE